MKLDIICLSGPWRPFIPSAVDVLLTGQNVERDLLNVLLQVLLKIHLKIYYLKLRFVSGVRG